MFFASWGIIDLRNKIILSKEPHPKYPTCQVLKYIDEYGIKEKIIIPGMEEYIQQYPSSIHLSFGR